MVRICSAVTLLVFSAWMPATVSAQSTEALEGKHFLAFRMLKWHASHFDSATDAAKHAKTLQGLECEVKTVQHNGHTDVQCRLGVWKSLALDSHDQVHQWQTWLNKNGFDTIHGHSATEHVHKDGEAHKEIVKYRLTEWKSQHAHQAHEATEFLTLYRALGCETEKVQHDGHTDIRVRCPMWMEVELPTHEAAHGWMEFLKKAGFETSHEH